LKCFCILGEMSGPYLGLTRQVGNGVGEGKVLSCVTVGQRIARRNK
jgi:hypothetical protein